MLSYDEMLRIARRYDTLISAAFLRALGQVQCTNHKRQHDVGMYQKKERMRYRGMLWCFRNTASPMDRH